jgi:hypothetical protein
VFSRDNSKRPAIISVSPIWHTLLRQRSMPGDNPCCLFKTLKGRVQGDSYEQ